MNSTILKQKIIEYAKEIGINKIGFTTAKSFNTLEKRLYEQRRLNYDSGFEEQDINKRVHPTILMPEAQSIISIAIAYPSKISKQLKSSRDERRGMFSRTSWGLDYHVVLRKKLNQLASYIKELDDQFVELSMVDTGPLSDRAVAERAGIGWTGKNCLIITEEYGSYVFLGEMITNIPFPPDEPMEDQCLDCTKCLDICPTKALVGPGQINAKACIAYLTQTKDIVPIKYREQVGNRLYGCDSCQTICPKNKGMDHHFHPEMEPDEIIARPLLIEMLELSNRQFKEKFGYIAGAWRGKKPLQRNALLGIAHFKDENAIPHVIRILKNEETFYLRATAAWALGKIGTDECKQALEEQLEKEQDERVLDEIKLSLNLINNNKKS